MSSRLLLFTFIICLFLGSSVSQSLKADDSLLPGEAWSGFDPADRDMLIEITFKDKSFTWKTTIMIREEKGGNRLVSSRVEGSYTVEGNKVHMMSTIEGRENSQVFGWNIEKGLLSGTEVIILEGEGKRYRLERGHSTRF